MESKSSLQLDMLTVGEWQENCYLLVDRKANEGVLIDPGGETERILPWVAGVVVRRIYLTHAHHDHLGAAVDLRVVYGASIGLHPADWELAMQSGVYPDFQLNDGELYRLGEQEMLIVHTPGHTPGSVCLRFSLREAEGRPSPAALVGDAIFPGGPGHTNSPEELELSLISLQNTVFTWPDETKLYPGHGPLTMVGQERRAFETFMKLSRPPDLCGDVSWRTNDAC